MENLNAINEVTISRITEIMLNNKISDSDKVTNAQLALLARVKEVKKINNENPTPP